MTSHRAPPELNGFGKTTPTPGFTRSSQVRMCFGLPLRRTKTTTDFETMPWYLLFAQVLSTSLASTSRFMSVSIEKLTTSAGSPAATALLCTSDAANELAKLTPLPVGMEYPTIVRFVPADRVGAADASETAVRAASKSRGRTERRTVGRPPFSI